jgi:dipeptidase
MIFLYLREYLNSYVISTFQRDHYEGTQFDLTKGLQAGPYGDPNRFDSTPVDGLTKEDIVQVFFKSF